MLSSFRTFSKSKTGTALLVAFLVAILASFALTDIKGISSGGGFGSSDALAKAGSEQVTERDFSDSMQRLLAAARQQNPEATYSSIAGQVPGLIGQLIDEASLASFADDHGMLLSKRIIDAEIATLPNTKGLDGKFSEEAYQRFLSQQRLTDPALRKLIRGDLLQRLMLGPVAANGRIPVGVATQYASILLEQRQGDVVIVLNDAFKAGLAPSAGDLQAYYDQNKQRYLVPEQRVLRLAKIGPEQVAGVAPTEQEIAAYYNANKATYGGRDIRVISQAVVPTKQAADAIAARARSGATFVAATAPAGFSAADISVGPQTLDQFTTLAGAKVAGPAFAAAKGAIVGPIQSDLGWHVVRIDDARSENGKTLAAAHAEIAAKLTSDKRKEALTDLVSKVEQAIEDGSSFAEAAAASKLPVTETPLIISNGSSRADPAYKLPAPLAAGLKTGFDLTADDDPVVETLPGDAGYVLVGVGKIVPVSPAPLASIKDKLTADWIAKKSSDRARTVAAEIAAKVARGVPIAVAAKQGGPGVSAAQPVNGRRIQLAQAPQQIAAPLKIIFSLPAGKSRMIADPQGQGYFIVQTRTITPGNATLQPGLISQVQSQFQQTESEELAQQFLNAVKQDVGVRRNESAIAAARQRLVSGGN